MGRLVLGSLLAAIVMFFLGFVFFGLAGMVMFTPIDEATATSVQQALAGILPGTGNYAVPLAEEAFMAGPSAVIQYVEAGGLPDMTRAMAMGFGHFLITAILLGLLLREIGGNLGRQVRIVLLGSLTMAFFFRLGDPLWYGWDWRYSSYLFVADAVMLAAGGLVLAWFTANRAGGPAEMAPAE